MKKGDTYRLDDIVGKKKVKYTSSEKYTEYTQDLADRICHLIGDGKSLRSVLKEEGMPVGSTVFKWLRLYPEFEKQYARACEERTEAMAEDILDLSDTVEKDMVSIQKVRLQTDNRKWLMSKMKPKKFGDKLDLTSDGKVLPTPIYGGQSGDTTPTKNV